LDAAITEATERLEDRQNSTVDRLVGGLDGVIGRFAGSQLVRDVGNLLDDSGMQLGDLTGA
jgi:hypothetical protein